MDKKFPYGEGDVVREGEWLKVGINRFPNRKLQIFNLKCKLLFYFFLKSFKIKMTPFKKYATTC